MLDVEVDVIKGIMFINLEGELNYRTISKLENELNYLLYKQGMHYFVFDFKDLDIIDINVISWLDNKLIEIFLSCGKVVLCGLDDKYENKFSKQERLFFVREGVQAFNYLTI